MTKVTMSKKPEDSYLKKVLPKLIAPVAIGIYITIAFAAIVQIYFIQIEDPRKQYTSTKILERIDQLSYDTRLKLRGARPASNNVAVLAIDDRSIDIVGRWPWPRDTMAKVFDNAFKYGAKVIAADIVWSEPSDRPETRLVEKIEAENAIDASMKTKLQTILDNTDADKIFSETIKKHADKFVLGGFYTGEIEWQKFYIMSGYKFACHDLILKKNRFNIMVEAEQSYPIINAAESFLPAEIQALYEENLAAIESKLRSIDNIPKTYFEYYKLERKIAEQKFDFCNNAFLNPKEDETAEVLQSNWAALKAEIKELTEPSFDEWMVKFISHSPMTAISATSDWTLNIDLINKVGKYFGYFNARLDSDGSIRQSKLFVRSGSKYVPSIALKAYLVATNRSAELKLINHPKVENLLITSNIDISDAEEGTFVHSIPVSSEGIAVINYAGPSKTIPHASAADLLDESKNTVLVEQRNLKTNLIELKEQPKSEFFKDKIFVVGATSIGVFDMRVTPFDGNFPGVETHANVIDNLLRKDFLAKNQKEPTYLPYFLFLLGIILSIALSYFGALSGLGFALAISAIIFYVDKVFLFQKGILVSTAFPIAQILFSYLILTFYKYFTEERSKKELRSTFSKYVSPAIVEEILQDPKNLELGGRKEHVTVFFSDVRGFTTISEKLDPRALSDLLSAYLTPMTDLVFKNRGTLDKYMGDAMMAFFGAPVHYPEHAKYACRCALQNLVKLEELRKEFAKKGLPDIDIGIGLNTGECSVGNMGSETVRSYTVMGDAVNLASRLEGINKTYGTRIIISEFTQQEAKSDFLTREVDWVRVKGKLKPVKIFELMAEGKTNPLLTEVAKYFDDGYNHYHNKQFAQAIKSFEQALSKKPEDETSKIYIERCQEFIITPPPPEWDGVYVMKTK
jgi:adenylate cyclase